MISWERSAVTLFGEPRGRPGPPAQPFLNWPSCLSDRIVRGATRALVGAVDICLMGSSLIVPASYTQPVCRVKR
jgi:hypothetical protein